MPLFRKPTTQELEDHFFGSGAFMYGWFGIHREPNETPGKFPVRVYTALEEETSEDYVDRWITEDDFIKGIKAYAETLEDRSFDDLIEDMDAIDVDNVIQLIMFGEIKYA